MEFRISLPESELKKITNNAIALRIGTINGMKKGMLFLQGEAQKGFVGRPVTRGTGAPLRVQTGTLRRGINNSVRETSNGVEGKIYDNVIYAAAIEYGYPPRNLPPRPFLRPVLEDKDNILNVERIIIREIAKRRNQLR